MSEFSDDLRRYLNGDVILARPTAPGARLLKRVTRNPALCAATAIALLAVAALIVSVPWYIVRLGDEKSEALRQRFLAETARREAKEAETAATEAMKAASGSRPLISGDS